jgi:transcriptional regulator with XRE-family HTH domain
MFFVAVKDIQVRARRLRKAGKTYREICRALNVRVPKSTLSYWLRDVSMSATSVKRIETLSRQNLLNGRMLALRLKSKSRRKRLSDTYGRNRAIYKLFANDRRVQKIALAMLYLAEGSKSDRASIMFGNSSPQIIKLFMFLLRSCYDVDERKFRVTVQCRADQRTDVLERFWSRITKVPLIRFYKAQIDKRTLGKVTRKSDYMGVCRIDYFSSDVDFELKCVAKGIERL